MKTTDLSEFKTKQSLAEEYPDLITPYQLEWLLRHRHENGLDQCVRKLGKRLVIHLPSFVEWLAKQDAA